MNTSCKKISDKTSPPASTNISLLGFETAVLEGLIAEAQYTLTLHTNLYSYGKTIATREYYRTLTSQSLNNFRNRLNRNLTGNGWRRKDHLKPIFIATIEALENKYDPDLTVHCHAILGNVSQTFNYRTVRSFVTHCWRNTPRSKNDLLVEPIRPNHLDKWKTYMMKESKLTEECALDWWSRQAPTSKIQEIINNSSR